MPSAEQHNIQEYPTWCYLLAGILAPLSFLRVGNVNITFFDILILFLALIVISQNKIRVLPKSIIMLSGVFLFGISITLFRAPNFNAAAQHVLEWFFIFIIVLPATYSFFRTQKSFYFSGIGIFIAALFINAYSIYELFYDPLGLIGKYGGGRYGGTLYEDPQTLTFKLSVTAPFVLLIMGYLFDKQKKRLFRFFLGGSAIILLIISLWLLQQTLSRSGTIAMLTGIIIYAIFTASENQKQSVINTFKILLIVMLVSIGMLLFFKFLAPESMVKRIEETSYWDSPEITDRTDLYIEAISEIDPSYYIIGVGPDNYQNISRYSLKVHNVILLMLVEGGVIVATCFVGLFIVFFIKTLSSINTNKDRNTRRFVIAVLSSMSAYVIIALLNTQSIDRYYWFVFALGLSASQCQGIIWRSKGGVQIQPSGFSVNTTRISQKRAITKVS